MKSPRSSFRCSTSARVGALAAGLLCLGLAGLATAAGNTPGGFQHPPFGGASAPANAGPRPDERPVPKARQVDVNNASKADLMKLPGIGAAEAERIVKGRPYLSKAALVTQQVLPMQTYEALHRRIYVGPVKGMTAANVTKAAKAASRP